MTKRHHQVSKPAGSEHPLDLPRDAAGLLDVLEHRIALNSLKNAAREWKRLRAGAHVYTWSDNDIQVDIAVG
jgi:hypothetical protein